MSDIMTIEQLAEISASELTDSDLLMTSVDNGNGVYTSKKMTLNALADYVNSRESGGGQEIISNGLVIYDREDENSLYLNTFSRDANVTLDKTFVQDVRFDILIRSGTITFKLNDKEIIITSFPGQSCTWLEMSQDLDFSNTWGISASWQFLEHHMIDVKAGQKVTLEKSTDDASFRWIRTPLKSGGIFIDTDKMPDGYTAYQTSGTITATDYCLVNVNSSGIPATDNNGSNGNAMSEYKASPHYYENNSNSYMVEPIPRHYVGYNQSINRFSECNLAHGQIYLRPGDTIKASKGWVYPIL